LATNIRTVAITLVAAQLQLLQKFFTMLYTVKEAAAFLKICTSTLYNYVANSSIKYYKKAGKIYFFKSNLLEFIKSGKTCEPRKAEVV